MFVTATKVRQSSWHHAVRHIAWESVLQCVAVIVGKSVKHIEKRFMCAKKRLMCEKKKAVCVERSLYKSIVVQHTATHCNTLQLTSIAHNGKA